jgi:uncharacterized protein YxjI
MSTFEIKQKLVSLGGEFDINNEYGNLAYHVKGSLSKIPKQFVISDSQGRKVATLRNVILTFLSKVDVSFEDGTSFQIKKKLTLFKPAYTIENLGLEIQGNFWDMNFSVYKIGHKVAQIDQQWLKLASTYHVEVYDDAYQDAVIALVIAIDFIKARDTAAASSGGAS